MAAGKPLFVALPTMVTGTPARSRTPARYTPVPSVDPLSTTISSQGGSRVVLEGGDALPGELELVPIRNDDRRQAADGSGVHDVTSPGSHFGEYFNHGRHGSSRKRTGYDFTAEPNSGLITFFLNRVTHDPRVPSRARREADRDHRNDIHLYWILFRELPCLPWLILSGTSAEAETLAERERNGCRLLTGAPVPHRKGRQGRKDKNKGKTSERSGVGLQAYANPTTSR